MAGVGFLITAAVLLADRLAEPSRGDKGPAETTWLDALLIGIAQMFAPLPGVSRSGLTIAAALALGLSRTWAVGFSLLIAVPAILGAAVKEIKDMVDTTRPCRPTGSAQAVAATDRGRAGRLCRHHLAGSDCPLGTHLVFFCILDRAGDRWCWPSRSAGDPPMPGERVLWTGPYGAASP